MTIIWPGWDQLVGMDPDKAQEWNSRESLSDLNLKKDQGLLVDTGPQWEPGIYFLQSLGNLNKQRYSGRA